jgi:hypothetical protein
MIEQIMQDRAGQPPAPFDATSFHGRLSCRPGRESDTS